MKSKRTYRAGRVEDLRLNEIIPALGGGCIVGIDVAKAKFVVALATLAGAVVRLLRFEHPQETRSFLGVLEAIRAAGIELRVAMEPTGTYGDVVRHQVSKRGFEVRMVSPKRTHDSRELFDGVPSSHDPKSAELIAKLVALGLSRAWSEESEALLKLRALVDIRGSDAELRERCAGRLEALLARHWPEFGQWLDLREQKTAMRLLMEFGSPTAFAADPSAARSFLESTSRHRLSEAAINGIVEGARTTLGVPMTNEAVQLLATLATQMHEATIRMDRIESELVAVGSTDAAFEHLAPWMGSYTAAVLVTRCNPRNFESARHLEKACGLNLRETSSGEHKGRLSISKRGPGLVRQTLYLFALRMIAQSDVVHAWYIKRRGYTEDSKMRAVIAVVRKLVRASFYIARGQSFDAARLFDMRRLDLVTNSKLPTKHEPRVTPRSIARGKKRGDRRAICAST